jgi:ATP-grasp domain
MKIGIIGLPRYLHLKQLILDELGTLDHRFCIFEEPDREFIDGGLASLTCPGNIEVVLPDALDDEKLADAIAAHAIDRIISFSDRGVVQAARLRRRFGMGGNSPEVEAWVVDKALMRDRLEASGLSRIGCRRTTLDRLLDDARGIALPVIVKPTSLGASLCVELIETPDAFGRYVERCRANKVFRDGMLTIEKYIPGPELSVEGIIARGEIHFLGVTESHTSGPPYFVGTGHDFLAEHGDSARIYAYTTEVIRCLQLDDCPFHIELKAAGDGYEVLEVHTRYAGAMIMELVERATGVRPFAHYVETLTGAPFHRPKPPDRRIHCEHLLGVGDGLVRRIGIDPAVTQDGRVISWKLDYREGEAIEADVVPVQYAGYVTFTAGSLEEANRFRAFIDDHFTIELSRKADAP